tara:strand:+ start:3926 stop:4390 length:465 start_codon:yes stop_codon:yes gene_type:complete
MISNATPLICLVKINQINLLRKCFKKITIPEDVKEEVLVEGKEGYESIRKIIEDGWIVVENPENNIDLKIGKEENAAINLAREKKDIVILDDAFAIKIAKGLNINTIRTTTVIFMSLKRGIITKKEAVKYINELIENGYYIKPRIYVKILEKLR